MKKYVSKKLTLGLSCLNRAAFAMGLLATKKDDSELAEALHLEAVLVLDRLPEARRNCFALFFCLFVLHHSLLSFTNR